MAGTDPNGKASSMSPKTNNSNADEEQKAETIIPEENAGAVRKSKNMNNKKDSMDDADCTIGITKTTSLSDDEGDDYDGDESSSSIVEAPSRLSRQRNIMSMPGAFAVRHPDAPPDNHDDDDDDEQHQRRRYRSVENSETSCDDASVFVVPTASLVDESVLVVEASPLEEPKPNESNSSVDDAGPQQESSLSSSLPTKDDYSAILNRKRILLFLIIVVLLLTAALVTALVFVSQRIAARDDLQKSKKGGGRSGRGRSHSSVNKYSHTSPGGGRFPPTPSPHKRRHDDEFYPVKNPGGGDDGGDRRTHRSLLNKTPQQAVSANKSSNAERHGRFNDDKMMSSGSLGGHDKRQNGRLQQLRGNNMHNQKQRAIV